MDNNTEITKPKKLNKANLPFLIAVGSIFIGILMLFFPVELSTSFMFLSTIILLASIILFPVLSVIGLILQILNKDKTVLDKILLGLNSVTNIIIVLFILFALIAFPNEFKSEKDVRKQISQEYSILDREYTPVLNYLAQYKKANGIYPETIDNKIIPKSEVFKMYEYSSYNNGTGYVLKIYPKNGPIEYYHNDEDDRGYNSYNGDGFYDGFLDNDFFYEINDKWHAIMVQSFTRHSIIWRATYKLVENNVEKFEEKGKKNK